MRVVDRRSSSSPPGSCCAPGSATGSSPSAATRTRRARSASRSKTVKIGLFMARRRSWPGSSACTLLFQFNTVQSGQGVGHEFIYIIAAVIGGCLLTGGYGSAIGAAIGALIFGMVSQGIVYAGWDPDWFKAFLGVMLLLARPAQHCASSRRTRGRGE